MNEPIKATVSREPTGYVLRCSDRYLNGTHVGDTAREAVKSCKSINGFRRRLAIVPFVAEFVK